MQPKTENNIRRVQKARIQRGKIQPGQKKGRKIFSRILSDALISPRNYVDSWVVNRGAE